jgi:hypothetical protein
MQEQLPLLARQAGLILFTDAVGGEGGGFNLLVEYGRILGNKCWNFKQSMLAGIGIGSSYLPARLAELIPWNQFLGSLKVDKFGLGSPFRLFYLCFLSLYSQASMLSMSNSLIRSYI